MPITIGVGEAFTTTLTVCVLRRDPADAPGAALRDLRVRGPGAQSDRAQGGDARHHRGARRCSWSAWCSRTSSSCRPRVKFLQGYNSNQFDNLVQAKPLYSFEVLTMGAIGLAFQLPLAMLGLRAAGRDQRQHPDPALALRYGHHRRHRGGDARGGSRSRPDWRPPRSSILFLASIVLLKLADRRDAKRAAAELITVGPPDADEILT